MEKQPSLKMLFVRFLKETNSYNNYFNVLKEKYYSNKERFNDLFYDKKQVKYIFQSTSQFTDWESTKQKTKYWYALHLLWNIKLYENNYITFKELKKCIKEYESYYSYYVVDTTYNIGLAKDFIRDVKIKIMYDTK